MNKLFKYILIGIGITSLSIASVNAIDLPGYTREVSLSSNGTWTAGANFGDVVCAGSSAQSTCTNFTISQGGNSVNGNGNYNLVCLTNVNGNITIKNNTSSSCSMNVFYMTEQDIQGGFCEAMTSLECQTEYNLIPVSEVTANYCRLNFDLIDPADCPIQPSGTGQISRSSLYINDTQYPGNSIIRVGIPDYIGRSITYNDDENLIDIEGYNADTEYIENVINQEKLTPTNEDFENMLVGLANFFPYLAIALLFYFLIKVVYKIFK